MKKKRKRKRKERKGKGNSLLLNKLEIACLLFQHCTENLARVYVGNQLIFMGSKKQNAEAMRNFQKTSRQKPSLTELGIKGT